MTKLITNNRRTNFRNARGQFTSAKGAFTVDTLAAGIGSFVFKTREELEDRALEFAKELVDYAKSNRPWTDRTGDAREGLDSQVNGTDSMLVVTLFHTVDYGVWLEVRWNAKYAIIIPTLEKKGSELLRKWDGTMSSILYYA